MPVDFSSANRQPMQQLHGTQAQWDALPKPALAAGQVAVTSDTGRVYIGTGVEDVLANPDTGLVRRPQVGRVVTTEAGTLGVGGTGAVVAYSVNGGPVQLSGPGLALPGDSTVDFWSADSVDGPVKEITTVERNGGSPLKLRFADLSQLASLVGVSLSRSPELTEIFLPDGIVLSRHHSSSHYYGISLQGCGFGAVALNRFFASLGPVTTPVNVFVAGNPGSATCNPEIATAKGYTVVGV